MTFQSLDNALVKEMRRLCREEGWTIPRCVEHYATEPQLTADAIRGIKFVSLANPVPMSDGRTLDDEVVLDMRRLRAQDYTGVKIAARYRLPIKIVRNAISGRSHQHLPNAITAPLNRALTDEQVIEMRRLYRDEDWTQPRLATKFGISSTGVSGIVLGKTYKHLPGICRKPTSRSLTDEQVLEMRAYKRDNPAGRDEDDAKRFGISKGLFNNIIAGRSYKHLPVYGREYDRRRYGLEQVLDMRRRYKAGESLRQIGESHGCNASTAGCIVCGEFYPEMPEAMPLRPAGKTRRLTPEQVTDARRQYRTRYVSGPTIAKELGIKDSIYNVLRGRAYKELPGAVPDHIHSIRRGVKLGRRIKKVEPDQNQASS